MTTNGNRRPEHDRIIEMFRQLARAIASACAALDM